MQKLFEMSPSVVLPTKQDFDDISALINTKADASAVEALGTEVAKKADASAVEAIDTRLGTAESSITALGTSKADASVVEALGTRVGTAEGAITDLGNNKMGWDVSTEGTPIVVDKDNNKISFQVAENGYLEVNAEGALDVSQAVVSALDAVEGKVDKAYVGDGLTFKDVETEVDGETVMESYLAVNFNESQFEIDDGGQLAIKAGTVLTPDSVVNGPDMPYHVTSDNYVKILTDVNSGIYTTTITHIDDNTGEEITGYGLTIDPSIFYSKLVTDHGFLYNATLSGQSYDFNTLGGVFDVVKAIVELLGGTITGWPVEATA
jgi:hypothetical protein